MNLLILFIILNVVNVILQTIKSLLTNKGNKWTAAIGNALAYGLYTVLLVYMNCDLLLWQKVVIVGSCNLIGVFLVKFAEEQLQQDKLWKIELTINSSRKHYLSQELKENEISHNWTTVYKWTLFNCYCSNKQEIRKVRELAKQYHAKYFANEAKFFSK